MKKTFKHTLAAGTAVVITGNESFTSLWMNFCPLVFAELFYVSDIGGLLIMNDLFKDMAKQLNWI